MSIKVNMPTQYTSYKAERLKEKVDKLEENMSRACMIVEAQAKKNVRVKTGRLRSSITHEVKKEGDRVEGIVGSDVEYAAALELGHGNIPPYPYLFPALEEKKGEVERALGK